MKIYISLVMNSEFHEGLIGHVLKIAAFGQEYSMDAVPNLLRGGMDKKFGPLITRIKENISFFKEASLTPFLLNHIKTSEQVCSIYLNEDGIIIHADRDFLTWTGYESDTVLNKPLTFVLLDRYQGRFLQFTKDILRSESTAESRFELVSKKSTVVPFRSLGIPYSEGEQRGICLLCVFEDSGDQQLPLTMYKNIIENSNDAILIHQAGIIRYVNKTAATLIGFSVSELLGQSLFNYVAPEYHELVMYRLNARLQGLDVPHLYEIGVLTAAGVQKSVELTATLIEYLNEPAVLVILRDSTDRQEILQVLKESQQQYKRYVEHAPYGVVVVDNEGTFLECNPAFCSMIECSRESLKNRTIMDFVEQYGNFAGDVFKKDLIKKQNWRITVSFKKVTGDTIYLTLDALRLTQSRVLIYCVNLSSLQERALSLQKQLENQGKDKQRFW